jgi:two-component system cell cycle sensor histidine kinase/response regulator CckA
MPYTTVLVVDDEPLVRELVSTALEREGYTVLVASSGEEALARASAHAAPIDLVVTDVAMPGLRGPELVPLLAARHPRLRALYMSGYLGEGQTAVAPLLAKPFGLGSLRHAVRDVLAEPHAA